MNRIAPFIVVCIVGACHRPSEPVIQYQFCSDIAQEMDEIEGMLTEMARRNKMNFLDRSAEAEQESRSLDRQNDKFAQSYPLIMMTIWRPSGPSLTLTNAGLPANQAVVGISGGKEEDSMQFAGDAARNLSKRWRLVTVPAGRGARPLNCP